MGSREPMFECSGAYGPSLPLCFRIFDLLLRLKNEILNRFVYRGFTPLQSHSLIYVMMVEI